MDLCSASDATDSKKRCGGTEQLNFDAKHRQYKQCKVEIQARDVNDIALYPSPMYHMLKRLNQHRFKWYFVSATFSPEVMTVANSGADN